MDEPIRVARASKADGALIERLMRHTIAEGAGADHGGDPLIIEAWSRSKQRAQITGWLGDPALYLNLGRWQGRKALLYGAAIATLPEEQAALLRVCYYEDKSHRQIARELDIPLGTVKSRLRYAMDKLRARLRT